MRERTAEFIAAEYRVKVSHFTRQGFDIGGVVHVGANDGYEIPFYLLLGAPRVIAFEPLWEAFSKLLLTFLDDPRVKCLPWGLSDHDGSEYLHVADGDGQGSTFLREYDGPYQFTRDQPTFLWRFDTLGLDLTRINTLVVDVQGMELQVLKGFGDKLNQFNFLNVECSRVPLYEGGVPAQEVIDFLDSRGFAQDSPIEDHNDIMFIRKGMK